MNRVQNSGFESGLDHWTVIGANTAQVVSVDTSVDWKKRGCNLQLSLGTGQTGVTQTIAGLAPNTSYKLAAWVYVTGTEQYTVSVTDYGGAPIGVTDSNPKFARKELLFTTGPQSTTATITLAKITPGPGTVVADDFGVAEAE